MSDVNFKKLKKSAPIGDNVTVKVTQMGHIVEVIGIAHNSDTLKNYVKLDKDSYAVVDRETGEIIECKNYDLNENRAQNTEGLKKTFKSLRNLINNNFEGANNELFITLTYRLNEDGTPQNIVEKASEDFDRFIKRFRRRYPDLEYIAVLEPQSNSAWHWHLLARFDNWREKTQIYLDNNKFIAPLWGYGFTSTKKLNRVDNVGAYLSAYLANVEINDENKEKLFDIAYKNGRDTVIEEKEITDEDGEKTTKKFIKGGRVYLYPSGTNIYRHSRGIVKPVVQNMTYAEAKQNIIGNKTPDYSRTVIIEDKKTEDENGNKRKYNTITYESYNFKRKKKKPVK